jgi:CheY-like chemotaxis protein
VEDDALVRESYGHLLQLWGCDVSEHASAEDALNFLAQSDWRPNMVVTDHRLGGVSNGRELIDLLRQHFVPSLPGVLITGDTEDTTLRTSLKPEINLLYKPVKPMILHRVLLQLWSEHTNVADVAPGELSS